MLRRAIKAIESPNRMVPFSVQKVKLLSEIEHWKLNLSKAQGKPIDRKY